MRTVPQVAPLLRLPISAAGLSGTQAAVRPVCTRCRRPRAACWCVGLSAAPTRTRVVFLQHPRERRVAFGTARMAHLALPNSELHVGLDFDAHPRVCALAATPGRTALLFPGPGSVAPDRLPNGPPATLIVVDGTWIQARKMLARNVCLQTLPRVGLAPARPGNYRIRREPAPDCLATIEAVVETLGALEADPARFRPMLAAFERMVDRQLAYQTARPNPYRRAPRRRGPRLDPVAAELRARHRDLVLVYGEANSYPRHAEVPGRAELIQLVALRPATGERFAALLAPRRALAPAAPAHLEMAPEAILAGEDVAAALERFARFLRRDDLYCAWGRYTCDLVRAERGPDRPQRDLRAAAAHRLGRRPGGIEAAARLLGAPAADAPWAPGRAGRRIVALGAVLGALLAKASG